MSLEAVVGELVAELRKTNTYLSALVGGASAVVQVPASPAVSEKADVKPADKAKPSATTASSLTYGDVSKLVLAIVAKFNKDKAISIYESIQPGVKKLPEMDEANWPKVVTACNALLGAA